MTLILLISTATEWMIFVITVMLSLTRLKTDCDIDGIGDACDADITDTDGGRSGLTLVTTVQMIGIKIKLILMVMG